MIFHAKPPSHPQWCSFLDQNIFDSRSPLFDSPNLVLFVILDQVKHLCIVSKCNSKLDANLSSSSSKNRGLEYAFIVMHGVEPVVLHRSTPHVELMPLMDSIRSLTRRILRQWLRIWPELSLSRPQNAHLESGPILREWRKPDVLIFPVRQAIWKGWLLEKPRVSKDYTNLSKKPYPKGHY